MFIDMYTLYKNIDRNDKYIKSAIRKMELKSFEEFVYQMCGAFFEGKTLSKDMLEIAEFVFDSGAFGFADTLEYMGMINDKVYNLGRLGKFIHNFSFDFKSMKSRYTILNKLPILYPFCCIYRLIAGANFRRSVAKSSMSEYREIKQSNNAKKLMRIIKLTQAKQKK